MHSCNELAGKAGVALESIVEVVSGASEQMQHILSLSRSQALASRNVSEALDEVRRISGRTTEQMSQASSSVTDLSDRTRQLESLIVCLKSNRLGECVNEEHSGR